MDSNIVNPTKTVIDFILNYSKSIELKKTKKIAFDSNIEQKIRFQYQRHQILLNFKIRFPIQVWSERSLTDARKNKLIF